VQLLAPVTTGQQFICQGFNYRSHVEESGLKLSDFPFNTIRTDDGAVDLGEQTTSITDDIPMEVRRAA